MSDFGSVSPLSELLSRRYEIFGDFLLFEWLAVFVCPARFRDFLFFSMLLFEWSPNNKVRDVDRVQSKKGTLEKREKSKESALNSLSLSLFSAWVKKKSEGGREKERKKERKKKKERKETCVCVCVSLSPFSYLIKNAKFLYIRFVRRRLIHDG